MNLTTLMNFLALFTPARKWEKVQDDFLVPALTSRFLRESLLSDRPVTHISKLH